jgi:hypothetical protein
MPARRGICTFIVGAGVATALLAAHAAKAQQSPPVGNLEKQFDQAFQQMLQDPANLDNTFRYAELAIQIGDYEAAISALERMLLFNPDLPRVRLELGVLYFRLGSYAIARTYLTRALEGEDVPDDVRARVATYLAEIDKRTSRHRFAGSVYGGVRYQTNANAGPERSDIRLLGGPATLDGEFTKKNDWNAFLSGSLRYTYDPQLQTGEVLQTDLLFYGANQFSQNQLDLAFMELKVGPSGQFWPDMIEGMTYRPYVVATYTHLDDSEYFHSFGGGLSFTNVITSTISTEVSGEHVRKDYRNNAENPTADGQNGSESTLRADVNFAIGTNSLLSIGGGVKYEDADQSLYSNTEYMATAAYTLVYDVPYVEELGVIGNRWTSSLSVSRLWTNYHAPDPAVDPVEERYDREWRINLLTSIPVTPDWAIIATLQRTVVDSNFKNFTYTNSLASIGASYRF